MFFSSTPFHRIVSLLLLFSFALLSIQGCAGPGVYHTVNKGETLWRISRTYGVELQEVAEINNIKDPTDIKTGAKIFIPGVSKVRKVVPYKPPASGGKETEGRIVVEKGRFIWPVKGDVISHFGMRNGVRHGGMDIKAEEGAPVFAADSGEVVFVDSNMRGYGRIIIIRHADDFYSVYAHNRENLVSHGEKVEKGARIATVGRSGNASTPHLHFEIRQGKTVRNPLFFLP
ncbi:MAG: M23 family metallopeptidase [Deltaproteobacteria bacterium]|nr:M23 family metallopeptidase [Deltaproteobacteria bacterium]MCL4872554.1 M23 family metallopeptidase [bacterium]